MFKAILVCLMVVAYLKPTVQNQVNLKPQIDQFFRHQYPDNVVTDICHKQTGVKVNKSEDILKLLKSEMDNKPIKVNEKCLIECIANLNNMTSYGILNPAAIIETVQEKFANTKYNIFDLIGMSESCLVRQTAQFGLYKPLKGATYEPFNICESAVIGLKCLYELSLTDTKRPNLFSYVYLMSKGFFDSDVWKVQ